MLLCNLNNLKSLKENIRQVRITHANKPPEQKRISKKIWRKKGRMEREIKRYKGRKRETNTEVAKILHEIKVFRIL